LVVGLGMSGRAAAQLCLQEGARVVCTDLRSDAEPVPGCELVAGRHRRQDFLQADLIVLSPGVPASQPDLRAALAAGVPVIGELGLAAERIAAPLLAVTGTNGKSTVTHFIGQLLAAAGWRIFVGGNIGRPLCGAVGQPWDAVVAEISSYQLEWPGTLAPRAACVLNLTPDHLARHGSMEAYGAAKCGLFDRMAPDAPTFLPADDRRLARLARGRGGSRLRIGALPGVQLRGEHIVLQLSADARARRIPLAGFSVPGAHNRDNAAVAAAMACAAGLPADELRPARLSALEHRMEPVGERGGVSWINDSKATNVAAAVTGLSGLGRSMVVLLGGEGKQGEDYALLEPALADATAVICFGQAGPQIAAALASRAPQLVATMEQAVARARQLARPGQAVVLSPACASFDEFRNFEHRGEVFRALAEQQR